MATHKNTPPQLVSPESFKANHLEQSLPFPTQSVLRKEFFPDSITEIDNRKLRFIISTGGIDRDADSISPSGWQTSNYLKNPVVLFAHDYTNLPVAKTTRLELSPDGLIAEAEFATAELNPFAESVYQMLKQGFLRGTSVGFRPIDHEFNSERNGVDFKSQELLEFSIVPVPANSETLMEASAAGIDIAPIKAWAKQIVETSEASMGESEGEEEEDLELHYIERGTLDVMHEKVDRMLEVTGVLTHDIQIIKSFMRDTNTGMTGVEKSTAGASVPQDIEESTVEDFLKSPDGKEMLRVSFHNALDTIRGRVS